MTTTCTTSTACAGWTSTSLADTFANAVRWGSPQHQPGRWPARHQHEQVERFAIRWIGHCQNPRVIYREGTQTAPRSPFEEHTRNRFVDVGGYRDSDIGDGLRAVYRARTVGNRVSERRWRGMFRIRVRVLRGGRLIDVCSARTTWRVVRQS